MSYDKEHFEAIVYQILAELDRAYRVHPKFPSDPIHQVSIMMEEAGEAVQAANDLGFARGDIKHVKEELVQTAAMCIRVLLNIDRNCSDVQDTGADRHYIIDL